MEIKIFNKDNLLDNEVNEVVTRVKVFLLNKENESLISTLKREMLEEAGISIDDSEIKQPFLEVKTYKRNHRETTNNRLSRIVYFFIKSNKVPDLTKLNLTDHERENNFQLKFIKFDNFEEEMQTIINNSNEDYVSGIANETLSAFIELKKFLNSKKSN